MLKVFVFEEEPALRKSLASYLEDVECCVVTPSDLSEATNAMMQETFDIILCDYWMGEIDGLVFFHFIKYQQQSAIKVLMTGYPPKATSSDIRWAGVDYVIHKSAAFECMETLKNSLAVATRRRTGTTDH